MAFLELLYVASMPIVKMFIIGGFGAFLATDYANVLSKDARKNLNRVVFVAFSPALLFSSLAVSVTFKDLISWWSMPVNVFLTFLFGAILGKIIVRITKVPPELYGIIVSNCCAGNMGNLLLIVIPALCQEKGSPFGNASKCKVTGTAYVSFSMALGSIFIWTYSYSIIRSSSEAQATSEIEEGLLQKMPSLEYPDPETTHEPCSEGYLSQKQSFSGKILFPAAEQGPLKVWHKIQHSIVDIGHLILDEIKAPPTLGVIAGFFVGAIPSLKKLLVGGSAPLRALQDSASLLGQGAIPSITLVMGGNLLKGLTSSKIKPVILVLVVIAKFIILPVIGIFIVKGAAQLGLLPDDPLYHFVLMTQYTVPPAMILGTIAQMFNVGEQECSVLFFWTYLVASVAVTLWSTCFMSLLYR